MKDPERCHDAIECASGLDWDEIPQFLIQANLHYWFGIPGIGGCAL